MTQTNSRTLAKYPNPLGGLAFMACLLWGHTTQAQVADRYESARKQMVQTAVIGSGVKHERVISRCRNSSARICTCQYPQSGVFRYGFANRRTANDFSPL